MVIAPTTARGQKKTAQAAHAARFTKLESDGRAPGPIEPRKIPRQRTIPQTLKTISHAPSAKRRINARDAFPFRSWRGPTGFIRAHRPWFSIRRRDTRVRPNEASCFRQDNDGSALI